VGLSNAFIFLLVLVDLCSVVDLILLLGSLGVEKRGIGLSNSPLFLAVDFIFEVVLDWWNRLGYWKVWLVGHQLGLYKGEFEFVCLFVEW
jgi:hypothetical protein